MGQSDRRLPLLPATLQSQTGWACRVWPVSARCYFPLRTPKVLADVWNGPAVWLHPRCLCCTPPPCLPKRLLLRRVQCKVPHVSVLDSTVASNLAWRRLSNRWKRRPPLSKFSILQDLVPAVRTLRKIGRCAHRRAGDGSDFGIDEGYRAPRIRWAAGPRVLRSVHPRLPKAKAVMSS